MLADELMDFVRRQPFSPYRIVTSDGKRYDIMHTDYALVLFDAVAVTIPGKFKDAEQSILVSLTHVIRIEFLDPDEVAKITRKRRKQ